MAVTDRRFNAVLREYGSAALHAQLYRLWQSSLACTLRDFDDSYPPTHSPEEHSHLLRTWRLGGHPLESELALLIEASPSVASFFSEVSQLHQNLVYRFFEDHKDTNTEDGCKRALKAIEKINFRFQVANDVIEKVDQLLEKTEFSLGEEALESELRVLTRRWRIHA